MKSKRKARPATGDSIPISPNVSDKSSKIQTTPHQYDYSDEDINEINNNNNPNAMDISVSKKIELMSVSKSSESEDLTSAINLQKKQSEQKETQFDGDYSFMEKEISQLLDKQGEYEVQFPDEFSQISKTSATYARRAIYGWSFILIVAEWFRVKKCLRDEYKRQKQLHKQNMIQYPKPSKSMYSIAAVRAKMNGHQLFEKYVCKSSMKAWYLFGIKLLLVNAARFNEINDKHKMKWHTVPQREQWKRALKESHDDWTIVHQHTREFEYSYPKAADAYVMIFGETPFAKLNRLIFVEDKKKIAINKDNNSNDNNSNDNNMNDVNMEDNSNIPDNILFADAISIELCRCVKPVSEFIKLLDDKTKKLFEIDDCPFKNVGDIARLTKIEIRNYIKNTKRETLKDSAWKFFANERDTIMKALITIADTQ